MREPFLRWWSTRGESARLLIIRAPVITGSLKSIGIVLSLR